MLRKVLKRILISIPVLVGVVLLIFIMLRIVPGDPVTTMMGEHVNPAVIEKISKEMGLDKPLYVQFLQYIAHALRGDFGTSYRLNRNVTKIILEAFPNTVKLSLLAAVVAWIIGIVAGIIAAVRQNKLLDRLFMGGALIGVSMPNFWFGLLVVIVFALNLGWLPSQGMGEGGVELLKSLVLPALTLGTGCAATITRMTRSSMLEVIHQDYIDTAKAKGVSERTITFRHMLKNALIPIVTAVGLQFGTLLGGAMLTETVFSWPGLGRLMVDSIKSKDIPMVLGSVIFMAVMFSIVNLMVDIIYAFVDPRIKSLYKKK